MTTEVKRRRGTTAQHATFTGAVGEITIDTDKLVPVIHNGSTVGGFPVLIGRGGGFILTNTAAGRDALSSNTTGNSNTAAGQTALSSNTIGNDNTAAGRAALLANTTGSSNTAAGRAALSSNTTGSSNTAAGQTALSSSTAGNSNTAAGRAALLANTTGNDNTAAGFEALRYKIDGTDNDIFDNCSGLGSGARVSASNQVQLGNSSTTTYVYGTVQNRSDSRDKADIRGTVLGLDFINSMRPVDYRWDMRDDYYVNEEFEDIRLDEDGNPETFTNTRIVTLPKDGSKKRNRYHHGVIAQDLEAVIASTGVDFGGYQDHGMSAGGVDVLSVGYDEFVAPLIKAVQELSAKNTELEARLAALEV